MELQPGTRIDRYVVETLLGRGGMASVWKVRHTLLDSSFALKVLELPRRSVRERLVEEGRIQARLKHPNLVSVIDSVTVEGCPGLVMEYVNGPSLDGYLSQNRLTLEQVDAIALDLIRGLRAAHAAGLVHRDLKPGNVLLARAPDGSVTAKIADFGLAKLVQTEGGDQAMTRTGQVMGTPLYMAPEQFKNAKDVDARADIYAMGVMLYELATHQRPYDGTDLFEIYEQVKQAAWPRPRDLLPELPPRMERAILGALAVDRDDRTSDCDRLLADWTGDDAARPEVSWNLSAPEPTAPPPELEPPEATFAWLEPLATPTWSEPDAPLEPLAPSKPYLPPPQALARRRPASAGDVVFRIVAGSMLLGATIWIATLIGGALLDPAGAGTVHLSSEGDGAELRVVTDDGTTGLGKVPAGTWAYDIRFGGGPWKRNPTPMRVVNGIPTIAVCDQATESCTAAPDLAGVLPSRTIQRQFDDVTRQLQAP